MMQSGPFQTIDSSERETVMGEGGTDDILTQKVYGELVILIYTCH